ncbi:MAG: glycosyltransferase, partial [Bacteroidota bacterium]
FGIIVFYFVNGFRSGWASIFVMLLFMLGVLLVSIGIVGVYLGKTYEQTKGRPKYIIDKTENL